MNVNSGQWSIPRSAVFNELLELTLEDVLLEVNVEISEWALFFNNMCRQYGGLRWGTQWGEFDHFEAERERILFAVGCNDYELAMDAPTRRWVDARWRFMNPPLKRVLPVVAAIQVAQAEVARLLAPCDGSAWEYRDLLGCQHGQQYDHAYDDQYDE